MNHPSNQTDPRLLSEERCQELLDVMATLPKGGGTRYVLIGSYWSGELRWARNRVSLSSDRRDIVVHVGCNIDGGRGNAKTNQLDRISLESVMRKAEENAQRQKRRPLDMMLPHPDLPVASTTTWSDATAHQTAQDNGVLIQSIVAKSEAHNVLSAGYLETQLGSAAQLTIDVWGRQIRHYGVQTLAQCSMTARHPKGLGSGWAGVASFDWNTIDANALADRALDKCLASFDAVRIEPGRYTVILEAQAVSDILAVLMTRSILSRPDAELEKTAFSLPGYDTGIERFRSKLGLKVVDERISIWHDPADPMLGIIPIPGLQRVDWITNGKLTALPDSRHYALNERTEAIPDMWRTTYRMSGGTTTIDEMIAGSERALLVTRFSQPQTLDKQSVLATGLTRDGLWLIEKGKISKPVRNFRWTESPLFVLNNVEQLGKPVPVFRPGHVGMLVYGPEQTVRCAIVPPLKTKDFSFTSTIDAI